MGNDQSCEPQFHLSRASLVVPAHLHFPRRPCRRGHRCSQDCLLDLPVLRAEARPPARVASHDFHQPLCVSDRSVVSGFDIGPFLCTDFLNCFVEHFVGSSGGSNVIVRSQPPGVDVKSFFCPVLGLELKPCHCGPKQTHRPQSVISVTAMSGRLQLTFRLSITIGFLVPSEVPKILFPWSYTLSRPAVLYAHPNRESL